MGKPKYQVSYTLKKPGRTGFNSKSFNTKIEADAWLEKNEPKLYWYQLTQIDAKSSKPKPFVEEPKEGYTKKIGILSTYFETGMECLGLSFEEDGIHGPSNPDFDPTKPESRNNFLNYSSYDALTFIETGHVIGFPDGTNVLMIKDREFGNADGWRLGFYPQGFSREELLDLFNPSNVRVTLWIKDK